MGSVAIFLLLLHLSGLLVELDAVSCPVASCLTTSRYGNRLLGQSCLVNQREGAPTCEGTNCIEMNLQISPDQLDGTDWMIWSFSTCEGEITEAMITPTGAQALPISLKLNTTSTLSTHIAQTVALTRNITESPSGNTLPANTIYKTTKVTPPTSTTATLSATTIAPPTTIALSTTINASATTTNTHSTTITPSATTNASATKKKTSSETSTASSTATFAPSTTFNESATTNETSSTIGAASTITTNALSTTTNASLTAENSTTTNASATTTNAHSTTTTASSPTTKASAPANETSSAISTASSMTNIAPSATTNASVTAKNSTTTNASATTSNAHSTTTITSSPTTNSSATTNETYSTISVASSMITNAISTTTNASVTAGNSTTAIASSPITNASATANETSSTVSAASSTTTNTSLTTANLSVATTKNSTTISPSTSTQPGTDTNASRYRRAASYALSASNSSRPELTKVLINLNQSCNNTVENVTLSMPHNGTHINITAVVQVVGCCSKPSCRPKPSAKAIQSSLRTCQYSVSNQTNNNPTIVCLDSCWASYHKSKSGSETVQRGCLLDAVHKNSYYDDPLLNCARVYQEWDCKNINKEESGLRCCENNGCNNWKVTDASPCGGTSRSIIAFPVFAVAMLAALPFTIDL